MFDVETSEGIDPWLLASDKVTLTPHFACNINSIYPCTFFRPFEPWSSFRWG